MVKTHRLRGGKARQRKMAGRVRISQGNPKAARRPVTAKAAKKAGASRGGGLAVRPARPAAKAPRRGAETKALKQAGADSGRTRVNASVRTPEEVRRTIDELILNDIAIGYLKKNVSKRAIDVLKTLTAPKTDEALASELDIKINAVRRILNIMQGYGITNYYVSKNVNGWLSFAWYVNVDKMKPFLDHVSSIESRRPIISNDCNDYFICNRCYDKTKLIFTFDAAFEENFKCGSCGAGLAMVDKDGAANLVREASAEAKQQASV